MDSGYEWDMNCGNQLDGKWWLMKYLVGGFKHGWLLCSISLIWDVIRNPLTNSIIFQDG
jgi:hypothetical protein